MKTVFLKNDEQANILREKLKLMPNESNIAVIGCGLTGSELIGSLLDYNKFNIHAIDALPRPLVTFDESISKYILELWKKHNINIYINHMVSKIDDKSIHFKDKTSIKYDLSIWCGGIKKSCLTEKKSYQN